MARGNGGAAAHGNNNEPPQMLTGHGPRLRLSLPTTNLSGDFTPFQVQIEAVLAAEDLLTSLETDWDAR